MKRVMTRFQIAMIIFWFLSSFSFAGGHWEQIRKADWIFPMNKVVFLDSLNGWIISDWNNLLYTHDGGRHWAEHVFRHDVSKRLSYFSDIAFANRRVGWIVGYDGQILKTIDGGKNWFFQISNTRLNLDACSFVDTIRGWVVGYDGGIFHTRDGGRTWEQQSITLHQNFMLNDVFFVDSLNGWAVGRQSIIMHTSDGGKTWEKKDLGTGNIFTHVFFLNKKIGWVVGDLATIAKTTDGGKTWTVHKRISGNNELLSSVFFVNEKVGWVVGGYYTNYNRANGERVFLKTTDGGETWEPQGDCRKESLHDVYFVNDSLGWAVGLWGTILHTKDAGKTWQWQMNFPADNLNNVYFIDEQNGWAGGKYTLIHTTDGGNTWSFIDTMEAGGIYFFNKRIGWLTDGIKGIFHTEDGGKTWTNQYKGDVRQIEFFDKYRGYAFGNPPDSSYGVYTINGGRTWKHLFTIYGKELTSYFFLDSLNGWAGGGRYAIWRTRDGGFHWHLQRESPQTPEERWPITSLCFVDTLTGWAVGWRGRLYYTTDGGNHWIQLFSHILDDFTVVHFFNKNEGWILGKGGWALYTADGGESWDASYSFDEPSALLSAFFLDRNHAWAVGPYGAVYKWTGTDAVEGRAIAELPEQFKLYPNYPNPFSPHLNHSFTRIVYALPMTEPVTIRIYNELGQQVRAFNEKTQRAGIHTLLWDGCSDSGAYLPAGTYFYQIQAGRFTATKKLLLLK